MTQPSWILRQEKTAISHIRYLENLLRADAEDASKPLAVLRFKRGRDLPRTEDIGT